MHFILDGRVGIMVPAGEGRTTRVRSLGRYTTIGEMGLVSHAPRSATIQAEVASVLYVLSTHQFEAIKTDDPRAEPEASDLFRVRDGGAADRSRTARSRCCGGRVLGQSHRRPCARRDDDTRIRSP